MHPSITPLADIYRLNTELLLNCIEDLDDERAQVRGDPRVNSIAFLVAHLTETRHPMAKYMGQPVPSPGSAASTEARTLYQRAPPPTLTQWPAHRERSSAHLAAHAARLAATQLAQPSSQRLPGTAGTLRGPLAFLAQHE